MAQKQEFPNYHQILIDRISDLEELLFRLLEQQPSKRKEDTEEKELLNLEQAAEFLSVSRSTIYSFVSQKKIPHMKKGKRLYFSKVTLREWIEESSYIPLSQEQKHHQTLQQFLGPRRKKLGS